MRKRVFSSQMMTGLLLVLFLVFQASAFAGDQADMKGKKKSKKAPEKAKVQSSNLLTTEARAGMGLFTGFPMGVFNKSTYTGFGVNLDGEYFLMPELSVGLNTGYLSFKYDEIHVGKGHFSTIPIQLRGSYYFLDGDFHPYGGLNAGIYLKKQKFDSIIEPRTWVDPDGGEFQHSPGGKKLINKNNTSFGFSPMIGAVYKIHEKLWLDFNVRYLFIMGNKQEGDKKLIKEENKSIQAMGVQIGLRYSFGAPGIW